MDIVLSFISVQFPMRVSSANFYHFSLQNVLLFNSCFKRNFRYVFHKIYFHIDTAFTFEYHRTFESKRSERIILQMYIWLLLALCVSSISGFYWMKYVLLNFPYL